MTQPTNLTIRITRDILAPIWTLSRVDLKTDSGPWLPFGFACEDTDRRVEEDLSRKVKGFTAIPLGVYAVELYDSPKHGLQTPQLRDVPGFRHIQIHSGNNAGHTEGCLLLGLSRDTVAGTVGKSKVACTWMVAQIRSAIGSGGSVTVEVCR